MNKKPMIENYIEIHGEDIPILSLTEEKRKEISRMIQDKMMESIGFQRASSYS